MPKFNRRQFLGSTAAAAAFAAAPAIVQAAVVEKKVDLVIVGGGLAGLAAANAAVKKGLKPIVLEKEAFLGGAGLFPEGSLGVGTRYQKEHGIKGYVKFEVETGASPGWSPMVIYKGALVNIWLKG